MSAASIRWRSTGSDTAIKQARKYGLLGSQVFESPFDFRDRYPHRSRCVRLRRGDRADPLDRGPARHAPAAPPLPRRRRPLGRAHADQQRRDVREYPDDHPPRGRVVRRRSAPRRARGPRSSPWPARSATPGSSRSPWARRSAQIVDEIGGGPPDGDDQGRADRRALRRLHPRRAPRHAGRLRVARRARLDHGLRRHDRDGSIHQHGRRRQVLHGILHGRVVRQVRPLPRRDRPASPTLAADQPAARPPAATSSSSSRSATWSSTRACAAWVSRRPTRYSAPCATSAASTRR